MLYHRFANVYDELMKNAPYNKWISFFEKIMKHYGKKPQNIVELGCGTGEITWRLKAKSYSITGVDISNEMLSIAKRKSLEKSYHIPYICQDISELDGFDGTDVFLSFCDVINYITDVEKLKQTFDKVYHQLTCNGIFIFDMHNYDYGKSQLINRTFTDSTETITYIWDCFEEKEDVMTHDLTFFHLVSSLYEKFTETHHQRLYSDITIENYLKKSGFAEINFFSDFKLQNFVSDYDATRKFVVARK